MTHNPEAGGAVHTAVKLTVVERLIAWLEQRRIDHEMRRFGGVQKCPWCRRWSGGNWSVEPWDRDELVDHFTCSNCGGTSLWKWEIGFIYLGHLNAPVPDPPAWTGYDIDRAAISKALGQGSTP